MASDLLFGVSDQQHVHRHDLVWIAAEFCEAIAEQVTDHDARRVAEKFLAAGWPLVVRRQTVGRPKAYGIVREADANDARAPHHLLAVGMPLPPSRGKLRLPFEVPIASILRIERPPLLREVVARLPREWRQRLQHLVRGADAAGIEFRVFGSAMWEAVTGCSYLTSQSDIDLLWRPADAAQLAAGIALLHAWENATGGVADGEILFGDVAAVAWREWSAGERDDRHEARVLIKALHGPRLVRRDELIALLTKRSSVRNGAVECV